MSEDSGAAPPPYVLDVSVLAAVARFDASIMTLIQEFDARGQSLVVPALALTGASLEVSSEDSDDLLEGLERLDNAEIAPLRDAEQATRLAEVIAGTGLDPWDAHVAAVADAAVCPVLTLNAAKWRQHSADLDEPLHIIEIADPDGTPDDPGTRLYGPAVPPTPRRTRAEAVGGRVQHQRRHTAVRHPHRNHQRLTPRGGAGGHLAVICSVEHASPRGGRMNIRCGAVSLAARPAAVGRGRHRRIGDAER